MRKLISLGIMLLLILLVAAVAEKVSAYPDMAGHEYPLSKVFKPTGPSGPTDDYPQMPGFPKQMGVVGLFSPCEGPIQVDLDGDGDLEVFAGSSDGMLYGWHHNGNNVAGFPIQTSGPIQSSPAAGDIDGDGDLEILIANRNGDVYAFHHNTTPVSGWPQHTLHAIAINSVALWDFDGDGAYEVFVASDRLYLWQGDGTNMPGFPVNFSGAQYGACSSSSVGDIDGDGDPEIIVEGWEFLNAFHHDGAVVSGWPYALPGGQGFSYAAPGLVDINNDGSLEIFCASHGSPNSWLYGIWGNGSNITGFPQSIAGWTYSTCAIGDMDGDGHVEITLLCNSGLLYAFETNGSPMAGWPVNMGQYNCEGALAMVDFDNNGMMDVFFGNNGGTGYHYYCYRANGTLHPDFPFTTTGASLPSCSAIADADGDGDFEIAFHVSNGVVNLWDAPYNATGAAMPWPQPHHDVQHTGNYHHGTVVHNVTVDLTPFGTPIVIPAGGGSFSYNIQLINHETNPVNCQFWTMLTLPGGGHYGPVIGPITRTLTANDTISLNRTQYIPGRAPTGNYTYTGYIGQYPGNTWSEDSFPFTKAGSELSGTGEWAVRDEELGITSAQPQNFISHTALPNPFNPTTVISYELRAASFVDLSVYDLTGKKVAELVNGMNGAGMHRVTFDGSNLASGIYLYRLQTGEYTVSGKMVLLK